MKNYKTVQGTGQSEGCVTADVLGIQPCVSQAGLVTGSTTTCSLMHSALSLWISQAEDFTEMMALFHTDQN